MKVADVFAGGGYHDRATYSPNHRLDRNGIFAERTVRGKVQEGRRRVRTELASWKTTLKNVVAVNKPFDAPDLLPVAPGSLDAVIIHLNYHDMVGFKLNRENVNAAVFKALKPGGIYGIVDPHAASPAPTTRATTLHRIDEDFLIKDVEKAGFTLTGASAALRHPEDDRSWNVFKHRGETDRFMLKFVKAPKVAAPKDASASAR